VGLVEEVMPQVTLLQIQAVVVVVALETKVLVLTAALELL
jgi:hypothetical protein